MFIHRYRFFVPCVLLIVAFAPASFAADEEARTTPYPASTTPDHIVLTWSQDPQTTQTIQWRTSPAVQSGFVRYRPHGSSDASEIVTAVQTTVEDPMLTNDPVNHRYTVALTELLPGTQYEYGVSTSSDGEWSDWRVFKTAPAKPESFQFVYLGDAQGDRDTWGRLLHKAHETAPDAAFYLMAGDMVNRGIQRDDWDGLFANAAGIFDHKPLVPVVGNHECYGREGPRMYIEMLALPENGPERVPPERVYSFEYGNLLMLVLDGNLPAHQQDDWLDEQLTASDAVWEFASFHQPLYSSKPKRDNMLLRKFWRKIFDKHHLCMALQGHDHAYLRTCPMKADKCVDSVEEGTVYVVSMSGTKAYDQDPRYYGAVTFTETPTYQVLDVDVEKKTLTYRAYDGAGTLKDELVFHKP